MKLASLKHGRDGRLVVVSRDLTRCADASAVSPTLIAALDDWAAAEPRLREIASSLEAGRIAHMPFDPKACAAPLPRSFGWADGSAYDAAARRLADLFRENFKTYQSGVGAEIMAAGPA